MDGISLPSQAKAVPLVGDGVASSGFLAEFGSLFAVQPLDSEVFCLKGGTPTPQNLCSWGRERRGSRNPGYLVWAVQALQSHASRWIT